MFVLDLCHGAGLFTQAFRREGFCVEPLCEIDSVMRMMYFALNGYRAKYYDIRDIRVPAVGEFGIIGGPPCQSHSKTRAMRDPKYPDLSSEAARIIGLFRPVWYLLENVVPIEGIPGSKTVMCDAMHYGKPHQSRPRWFTYSPNLTPPKPLYEGTVDDLMAYPSAVARLYGPKRGAVLQGIPEFASLRCGDGRLFKCAELQLGLANGVCLHVGRAWARSIKETRFS